MKMLLRRSRVDYPHLILHAAAQLYPSDQHQFQDHLAVVQCLKNQEATTELYDRGLSHSHPLQSTPQSLPTRQRRGKNGRKLALVTTLAAPDLKILFS